MPAESMIRPATTEEIARVWSERWGLPVIALARSYRPDDVEGIALAEQGGAIGGLVTWKTFDDGAEIVTLDAWPTGQGRGTRLLQRAEQELRRRGVKRLFLVTTNDNPRALNLYVRHGFRLVRLHLDAMDRVRARKPDVPLTGADGIPLRDMWELEKPLEP